MWPSSILKATGNTPLVHLSKLTRHLAPTLLAKVEYYNPGNSVKDRVALEMIDQAERQGLLKPGGTVVEATSGNTGVGVALVCASRGYQCIVTMSDKQSQEKIDILRALGARVELCPASAKRHDPASYYSRAQQLADEIPGAVYLNQYDNPANWQAHYKTLGPEIWQQTQGRVTHLVAAMGTCGTLCGTAKYLKEQNPDVQVIGVDVCGSILAKLHRTGEVDMDEAYPFLTESVGRDFVPMNLDLTVIDRVVQVNDAQGAMMARELARTESIFAGWSSGTALYGAMLAGLELRPEDVAVVILPDHGSRYLGKIYNDAWMREKGLLQPDALLPVLHPAEISTIGGR